MNIKFLYTVLLMVCTITSATAQWGKTIKGSRNVITKTINTTDYDVIDANGSMTVILDKGAEGKITIEAEDNITDFVTISTEGNVLKIGMKKNKSYNIREGIKVYVPFTDLNELQLNGSGSLISNDIINATTFSCTLRGSGDINAEVNAATVNAFMNGSGDIDLSGTTNSLSVSLTGSGDFNAFRLTSHSTEATLKGSGDIQVNAQKEIKARLIGSGDIEYSGNPKHKDVNVRGSGDIDAKG